MHKIIAVAGLIILLLSCEKQASESKSNNPGMNNTILALHDTILQNGSSYSEIYSISQEGTNAQRLTTLGESPNFFLKEPCWGPDGKIYFTSRHEQPDYMVYAMNSDGSDIKRITTSDDYYGELSVSIAGKRIVYRHKNAIRSSKLDGTDEKTVTTDFIHYPSWHPDGKRIIFASDAFVSGPGWNNIYLINYDGSGVQQLTSTQDKVYAYPLVSPDATKISYMIDGKVYIANIDGSDAQNLNVQNTLINRIKGWTSDGQYLLALGEHIYSFYLIKANGGGLKQVTTISASFYSPAIK